MEKLKNLFIQKPSSYVEKPGFFKKGFEYLLRIVAFGLLAYGMYAIIANIIDYFDYFGSMDAWQIIRAIFMIIISMLICVIGYLFMAGMAWKRADDIKNDVNDNLVDIVPLILKAAGEITAIFILIIGVLNFFAGVLAVLPLFPFADVYNLFDTLSQVGLPNSIIGIGVDSFKEYMTQLGVGGIGGLVLSILLAFINLAILYLAAELYKIILTFFRGQPSKLD